MRKEHDEKLIKSSMHGLRKEMRQKKQEFETLFVKRWLCVIANNQRIIKLRSKLEELHSGKRKHQSHTHNEKRKKQSRDNDGQIEENEESRRKNMAGIVILRFLTRCVEKTRGKKLLKAYTVLFRVARRFVRLVKMRKQQRAIDLIKLFVEDQSSSAMFQIMKRYRYNVIKCQRFYRAFRRCKHSRIVALSLRWSTLEAEYGRYIQEKRRNELKGKILALKEKGAEEGLDRLSIHQRVLKREQDGIPEDPGDLYLGEENAAHLDYHLLKGLENIVDKAAPKNNAPVSFNIRFEMLHRFLTRIRRKHDQRVHKLKKEMAFRRTIVTVDDLKVAMTPNVSITEAISMREESPLPAFYIYSKVTRQQMLNLVKEGHRYERKFEKIEGGFQSTLYPLPFVKSFFKARAQAKKRKWQSSYQM